MDLGEVGMGRSGGGWGGYRGGGWGGSRGKVGWGRWDNRVGVRWGLIAWASEHSPHQLRSTTRQPQRSHRSRTSVCAIQHPLAANAYRTGERLLIKLRKTVNTVECRGAHARQSQVMERHGRLWKMMAARLAW